MATSAATWNYAASSQHCLTKYLDTTMRSRSRRTERTCSQPIREPIGTSRVSDFLEPVQQHKHELNGVALAVSVRSRCLLVNPQALVENADQPKKLFPTRTLFVQSFELVTLRVRSIRERSAERVDSRGTCQGTRSGDRHAGCIVRVWRCKASSRIDELGIVVRANLALDLDRRKHTVDREQAPITSQQDRG